MRRTITSPGPDGRRPDPGAHPVTEPPQARTHPEPAPWVRTVDADVVGAVQRTLAELLGQRTAEAEALDSLFAADVADRVARFTLGGGKRVRAQFLWWGMRAAGGGTGPAAHAALRLAAALELVQTCALVHDDVMDGSPLRRGAPAVHTALGRRHPEAAMGPDSPPFGHSAAVLVGDLALSWADDTVAATSLTPDVARKVREVWSTMRTEMVAGQYLDLHGRATGSRSAAQATRVAGLKSALYTVERPLDLGAAVGEAPPPTHRALCGAGRSVGLAFQLRDDLVGAFGSSEESGKPSGEDLREGRATYLTAVARARAASSGAHATVALLDRELGDPHLAGERLERLREALEATGARAQVESRIRELVARATDHLAASGACPEAADRLTALFHTATGLPAPAPLPALPTEEGPR